MSVKSPIEWIKNADGSQGDSWNPLAGCIPKGPGCLNCYAAVMSFRLQEMGQEKYMGLTVLHNGRRTFNGKINYDEKALRHPLNKRKPTTYFVNSMSDLFFGDDADRRWCESKGVPFEPVPFEFIDKVFAVMALSPQHTFKILTKREGRAAEYIRFQSLNANRFAWRDYAHFLSGGFDEAANYSAPLTNVQLGISVEDQKRADGRRESLKRVANAGWFTWVSYEPALGMVDWTGWEFIRWMVSGGESGPNARPSHPDWHRATRDWCAANGVPFFFKQWGEWVGGLDFYASADPEDNREGIFANLQNESVVFRDDFEDERWFTWNEDGDRMDVNDPVSIRIGKKSAGRLLDGRTHDDVPASSLKPLAAGEK
jgi:protein gp37